MFGKNPQRPQDLDPAGALFVEEVFGTLQGEGPYAGEAAVFVRLSGCNLACWFCDTQFEEGMQREKLSAEALVERIEKEREERVPGARLIVLTGGEPLRQNILPLLHRISGQSLVRGRDYLVQIETAGTLWVPGLEQYLGPEGMVAIVCSPKTPKVHPAIRRECQHWKYILSSLEPQHPDDDLPCFFTHQRFEREREGKPVINVLVPLARPGDSADVWVQPCDEGDVPRNRLNAELCAQVAMKRGYRVSLQLHKLLDLP